MSSTAQTSLTPEWEAEKVKQEEIAAQIASDAPVKSVPQVAGTPAEETEQVVEELPQVTLRPVGEDIEYPLTLSVVGAPEGGFVFESASDTVDVDPQVAEQVTYLTNVEVAV